MHRKQWKYRTATERRYFAAINKLTQQVEIIAQRYTTVDGIVAALSVLAVSPDWRNYAVAAARQMVNGIASMNAVSWREAAKEGGRAHEIHRLLKSEMRQNKTFQLIIEQNAELIGSMPSYTANRVVTRIAAQTVSGRRAETMVAEIRAYAPKITEARAALIARTETAKAQAAITQSRSLDLGIDYYRWETSMDQRVRSSHAHMQDVICSYSQPPNPEVLAGLPSTAGCYCPGGVYNCRCYAAPIVDVDFEIFPAKMVQGNQIISVTKAQFLALSQGMRQIPVK